MGIGGRRDNGFFDDEGADWLLGEFDRPATAPIPVAEPAESVAPAAQYSPPPAPEPVRRHQEVDDWFSLAEPAATHPQPSAEPDAATRAQPIIGGPMVSPGADALQQFTTPSRFAEPAPAQEAPNGWAPPPPVFDPSAGPRRPVIPPPAAPPAVPTAPPGPVTPTAPFALTWGEEPAGNAERSTPEDSLRAAFAQLAQPATPFEAPNAFTPTDAAGYGSADAAAGQPAFDAGVDDDGYAPQPFPSAPIQPQRSVGDYDAEIWSALSEPEPEPEPEPGPAAHMPPADAQYAQRYDQQQYDQQAYGEQRYDQQGYDQQQYDQQQYDQQAYGRQRYAQSSDEPQYEPYAEQPSAQPPADHSQAWANGYDDQTQYEQPAEWPGQYAEVPHPFEAPQYGGQPAVADERYADQPGYAAPEQARPAEPDPWAPQYSAPQQPEPVQWQPQFDARDQWAAGAAAASPAPDTGAGAQQYAEQYGDHPFDEHHYADQQQYDGRQYADRQYDGTVYPETEAEAEPAFEADPSFPFLEVRGPAGAPEPVGAQQWTLDSSAEAEAEAEPLRPRTPFPAFAAVRWDDEPSTPDDAEPPVDDLLAALGGGARPRPPVPGDGASGPVPPTVGRTEPDAGRQDFAALGFDDDDDEHDGHDDDLGAEPARDDRDLGEPFRPARAWSAQSQAAEAERAGESSFAWNLTANPLATDPKAEVDDDAAPAAPGQRRTWLASDDADEAFGSDDPAPTAPYDRAAAAERGAQYGRTSPDDRFDPRDPGAGPAGRPDDADGFASLFGAGVAASAAAASGGPQRAAGAPFVGGAGTAANARAVDARQGGHGGQGGQGGHGGSGSNGGPGAYRPGGASGGGAPAGGNGSGVPKSTLLWVAGGLVALLVIVGLFYFGTQLGGGGKASTDPSASATRSETATATPPPAPTAIQPAGVHAWDTMFGGECIDPYSGPWAEEFTVVDCAAPHAAQLVYRGSLSDDPAAAFPGEAEAGAQAQAHCASAGVVDVAAAAGIPDLQVQSAYPVTEEQWAAGVRSYYCFVNRAGGEALTASLQGTGPTA